jgi:hypothetical protein
MRSTTWRVTAVIIPQPPPALFANTFTVPAAPTPALPPRTSTSIVRIAVSWYAHGPGCVSFAGSEARLGSAGATQICRLRSSVSFPAPTRPAPPAQAIARKRGKPMGACCRSRRGLFPHGCSCRARGRAPPGAGPGKPPHLAHASLEPHHPPPAPAHLSLYRSRRQEHDRSLTCLPLSRRASRACHADSRRRLRCSRDFDLRSLHSPPPTAPRVFFSPRTGPRGLPRRHRRRHRRLTIGPHGDKGKLVRFKAVARRWVRRG